MNLLKTPLLCLAFLCMQLFANAAITVTGADDSDGSLVITVDTIIDLGLATDGAWDDDNTANTGNGVYDSAKWAVVFKYSSVSIASGATLTFTNNPSTAPVVWLVSGDVTVEGTISLNGEDSQTAPTLAEAGPGGFRGGSGNFSGGVASGSGFGPGGGAILAGGSFGTLGVNGSTTYGNPSLIPLIGGSGGGGDNDRVDGGAAGGGAMLIASEGTITVSGEIRANGGVDNGSSFRDQGSGSGGGVRLIADAVEGDGNVYATGGNGRVDGGAGRIRIERVSTTDALQVIPSPSVLNLTGGDTAMLWAETADPIVEIVSIGGEAAPADPLASFGAYGVDVAIADDTTTTVIIQTTNVEEAAQVIVRVGPRNNGDATYTTATLDTVVSESPKVITWTADVSVQSGHSALQVQVIRP